MRMRKISRWITSCCYPPGKELRSAPAYYTLLEMPEFFSVPLFMEHYVALPTSLQWSPTPRHICVPPAGNILLSVVCILPFLVYNLKVYMVALVTLVLKTAFIRDFAKIYKICLYIRFHTPDPDYSLIVALNPWKLSAHFCAADNLLFLQS
jgi:hypothetical protein